MEGKGDGCMKGRSDLTCVTQTDSDSFKAWLELGKQCKGNCRGQLQGLGSLSERENPSARQHEWRSRKRSGLGRASRGCPWLAGRPDQEWSEESQEPVVPCKRREDGTVRRGGQGGQEIRGFGQKDKMTFKNFREVVEVDARWQRLGKGRGACAIGETVI